MVHEVIGLGFCLQLSHQPRHLRARDADDSRRQAHGLQEPEPNVPRDGRPAHAENLRDLDGREQGGPPS